METSSSASSGHSTPPNSDRLDTLRAARRRWPPRRPARAPGSRQAGERRAARPRGPDPERAAAALDSCDREPPATSKAPRRRTAARCSSCSRARRTRATPSCGSRPRVGAVSTVFVGDDVTDEEAFAALGADRRDDQGRPRRQRRPPSPPRHRRGRRMVAAPRRQTRRAAHSP